MTSAAESRRRRRHRINPERVFTLNTKNNNAAESLSFAVCGYQMW